MGYLDSTSVTVDATLTVAGRRQMAEGFAINPVAFSVHDTGIDYSLWYTGHPSGSENYGEAIESLPMIEATPHQNSIAQDVLFTLTDSSITAIPYISFQGGDNRLKFGDSPTPITVNFKLYNWSAGGAYGILVPDRTKLKITPLQGQNMRSGQITGTFKAFHDKTKTSNGVVYYVDAGGSFEFSSAQWTKDTNWEMDVVIIHLGTGAYRNIKVQGEKNTYKVAVDRGPAVSGRK